MGFLRSPYPEAVDTGFWGPVTSTIDWCEENYVVTHYVAEWSNTISNLCYILVSFYLTYRAYKINLETRFIFIGLTFAIVGFGSWWFHMTLLYRYQLLDELPMIYATAIPTWSMVSEILVILSKNNKFKYLKLNSSNSSILKKNSENIHFILGSFLTILCVALTAFYLLFKKPIIHQVAYGFLNGTVVIASNFLTYNYARNSRQGKNMYYCMGLGTILFALGFTFWNLDIHMCSFWIHIRRDYLQLPFGIFLELHAWWHFFTGLGIYYYVVSLELLRVITQGKDEKIILVWRYGIFPDLITYDEVTQANFSKDLGGNWRDHSPSPLSKRE